MEYLKNSLFLLLVLLISKANAQDTDTPSKLKDFEGVWQFVPPRMGYDSVFYLINKKLRMDVVYWNSSKEISVFDINIIGFKPKDKGIFKLSDLSETGNHLYFYTPNPGAPNDSIKYFHEASPSCAASFNGLGTDTYDPPGEGEPNYFLFNFNGREYEYHVQRHHLPNYVLSALAAKPEDMGKVETFLGIDYGIVKETKSHINSKPNEPSKMYLLKGDPVEILKEEGGWLKIKYYPEKDGKWTGETIEGWIRKEDVE